MSQVTQSLRRRRRAFSLIELCCSLAIIAVLLAVVLPALGRTAKSSMLAASFGNLMDLGVAHALYAGEWNGRQVQIIAGDLSAYGSNSTQAFFNYNQANDPDHPPVGLGWGTIESGGEPFYFAYRLGNNPSNEALAIPLSFEGGGSYFGSFRLPNVKPFQDYLGGRFYDPTFYAPADGPVWDTVVEAGCLASPEEFVDCVPVVPGLGDLAAWASYCTSPAALYHPDVMRHPAEGGWRDPWTIDQGFETPGLFQARHPALPPHFAERNA